MKMVMLLVMTVKFLMVNFPWKGKVFTNKILWLRIYYYREMACFQVKRGYKTIAAKTWVQTCHEEKCKPFDFFCM